MIKVAQVKGYPRYNIWSNGQVWSYGNKRHSARFLKESTNKQGYLMVWLSNDDGRKMFYVHRLVAEAFLDKEEGYNEVNHIDGIKLNNSLSNLEWTTRSKNVAHAFDKGLKVPKRGTEQHNHKLSDAKVRYIRSYVALYGKKYKKLAEELGVDPSTVRAIAMRRSWSHV